MQIAIPTEAPGERRVAMPPQVALRLIEQRHRVVVEEGAGEGAGFDDEAYRAEGVEMRADPYPGAKVVLVVGPATAAQARRTEEEAVLIGFLDPFSSPDLIHEMLQRRITSFAM